ncbi:MAG: acylphosphatase [Deltaproteobacteria bacterium]|nr:acylphosphatase [Deltaproteobacteria bacterium]TLN05163.1 MAG: acylphosphatase [bacterium]
MKTRALVTVRGLVQGVSFRYHTRQMALQLKVTGWVRNLPNGDVQGCFEGDEGDVQALIDWCREGPSQAEVESVTVEKLVFNNEFKDFHIRQ